MIRSTPPGTGTATRIIPGLGQAYVGARQSAAVALVINTLFIGTTVELFRNRLWFAGSAAAVVSSVTYGGNIVKAAEVALAFNSSRRYPAQDALERSLFPEFFPRAR